MISFFFLIESYDSNLYILLKAMGMKSSSDRDQLKMKIKELRHAEVSRLRERLLNQSSFHRSGPGGHRLRSSSLTKLKERKFFGGNTGK